MSKQTKKRSIFLKEKALLIFLGSSCIICLLTGFCWFMSAKWTSMSTSKITINGRSSPPTRIYKSPSNKLILVAMNSANEKLLYMINLSNGEMGFAAADDFYFIADSFALPKTSSPTLDLMPSVAFGYPDPHLVVKDHEIDFRSFKGLETKIFFKSR